MAYKIIWSKSANEDYYSIIRYLMANWSFEITEQFIFIINKRLDNLCLQPFIGKPTMKNKNIRSILITKHNKLFYCAENNIIEILYIFDTRQDPTKSPY